MVSMHIVVLTGAGISRESGLKTFRDGDGLWAGHRIEDVCTPRALARDPALVLDFYNMRRREVISAQPNAAHLALAQLQDHHRVDIITQNVDDLHERAGSQSVLHLHGEVLKSRSMRDFDVVVETREDIHLGDVAPDGAQLRPHICFFEETPYRWDEALNLSLNADLFVVVGTSLQVYPAAGLVDITRADRVVLIDPNPPALGTLLGRLEVIAEPASEGVPKFVAALAGS